MFSSEPSAVDSAINPLSAFQVPFARAKLTWNRLFVDYTGARDRESVERAVGEAISHHDVLRGELRSDVGALSEAFVVGQPTAGAASHDDRFTATVENSGECIRVVLAAPSVACDLAGLCAVAREIAALLGDKQPADTPQYCDVSASHWEMINQGELEDDTRYWRDQASLGSTYTELPFLRPGRGDPDTERPSISEPIPGGQLAACAEMLGVPQPLLVAAAVETVVARTAGKTRACIGMIGDARELMGLDGLPGVFSQILPDRFDYEGDTPFRDFALRIRERYDLLLEHQGVIALNPDETVSITFRHWTETGGDVGPVSWRVVDFQEALPDVPLALDLTEADEAPRLRLTFDETATTRESAEQFLGRVVAALATACEAPGTSVGDLPFVLPGDERTFELATSDRPSPPCETTIVHAFLNSAESAPARPALSFGSETLTYSQLRALVGGIAARLAAMGVGPGDRVALCMRPSPELVATSLAVMWLGAAYVPLDPQDRSQRIIGILRDAGAALVTVHADTADQDLGPDTQTLLVSRSEVPAGEPPAVAASPGSIAYIMYTSGSTGTPKGALVTQRSVVSYLSWVNNTFWTGAEEMPVTSKYVFDAVLKQVFGVLMRGACVWLLSHDVVSQPSLLLREVATRQAVLMNCVVTTWSALLDEIETLGPADRAQLDQRLRGLLIGGEKVTGVLLRRTRELLPRLRIWVLYGPTEATATATCGEWLGEDDPLLGKPAPGVQLKICDERGQLVPPGVAGEIFIGGVQVAAGYWRRPELTRQSFAEWPDGSRWYATGDLGTWTPDGRLRFLGRGDGQVKIRGQRVEIGEAEHAFSRIDAVRAAAVVPVDLGEGLSLYGFIVPRYPVTIGQLRQELQGLLPDYMIPTRMSLLRSLPLTGGGKVDRRELVQIALNEPKDRPISADEQPRTPEEREVAAAWSLALGIESIGREDDFFLLGGHSLLIARIVNQLRQTGAPGLSLRESIQAPTIAAMARLLSAARDSDVAEPETDNLVQLSKRDDHGPVLICVHPAGGTITGFRRLAPALRRYHLVSAFQAFEPRTETLVDIATRYSARVAELPNDTPVFIAGWSAGGAIAFEMTRLLISQGRSPAGLVLIDSGVPYIAVSRRDGRIDEVEIISELFGELDPKLRAELEVLSGTEERLRLVGEGMPAAAGIDIADLRRMVAVYEQHLRACNAYPRNPEPVPTPAVLIRAKDETGWPPDSPDLGWRGLVTALEIREVPGDHFSLLNADNVGHVAGIFDGLADELLAK